MGIAADGAVGVIPDVMHAHVDELLHPVLVEQFVDIRLAGAGGNAGDEAVFQAVFQAPERVVQDVEAAAALIGNNRLSLDADQRGAVAEFPHFGGNLVGDELAIGEDLEVAIGMTPEDLQQFRVHERFAAEDAEEAVAVLLGVVDDAIHLVGREKMLRAIHLHPASLATEIATVDHRNVEERREIVALLDALLEFLDRAHAFVAEVIGELPENPLVDGGDHSLGHL